MQKAVERIQEKRRYDITHQKLLKDQKLIENNSARIKWKESFRKKREQFVEEKVDMNLLRDAISKNPRLLTLSDEDFNDLLKDLLKGLSIHTDISPTENHGYLAELSRSLGTKDNHDNLASLDTTIPPASSEAIHLLESNELRDGDIKSKRIHENDSRLNRLIKTVFVCGASADDLEHILSNSQSSNFPSNTLSSSSSSSSNTSLSSNMTAVLNPKVLYTSDNDTVLSKDIVARLCFPTDVEVSYKYDKSYADPARNASPPTRASISSKSNRSSVRMRSNSITDKSTAVPNRRRSSNQFFSEFGDKRFVTLFTDDKSNISYGICFVIKKLFRNKLTGVQALSEYCICLVSDYPLFNAYFHLMDVFISMGGFDLTSELPLEDQEDGLPISADLRSLNDLAMKLHKYFLPKPTEGLEINVGVHGMRHVVNIQRLMMYAGDKDKESAINVLMWALPILLRSVPLDQIILIIGCALAEMKIFVCSSDSNIISGCILAILYLLRPLKWTGSIVVPMPQSMPEFLDSIGCCMVGLNKLPNYFTLEKGMIVVDPKDKIVHMDPADIVTSHTFLLPQASKLNSQLKPLYNTILSMTKTKYTASKIGTVSKARASSISSSNALPTEIDTSVHAKSSSSNTTGSSPGSPRKKSFSIIDNSPESSRRNLNKEGNGEPSLISLTVMKDAVVDAANLPTLPLELDFAFSDGTHSPPTGPGVPLFNAVSSFSSILENHIRYVINTTIEVAWDDKIQRSLSRKLGAAQIENDESLRDRSDSDTSSGDLSGLRLSVSSSDMGGSGSSSINNWAAADPQPQPHPHSSSSSSFFSSSSSVAGSTAGSSSAVKAPNFNRSPGYNNLNSKKIIGDVGLTFVKRFRNTQLFCSYCETASNKKREQISRTTSEESDYNSILTEIDSGASAYIYTDKLKPFKKGSKHKDDPLVSLITIMLTGTIPLSREKLLELDTAFKSPPDDNTGLEVRIDPRKRVNSHLIEDQVIWCNGRCAGKADTPSCTLLCLNIWEKKVRTAKHQLILKDIIDRHHHCDLVLHPIRYDAGQVQEDDLYIDDILDKAEHANTLKIKPHHGTRKHPKETQAQFLLRQSIVNHKKSDQTPNTMSKKQTSMLKQMFDKRKKIKNRLKLVKHFFVIRKFLRYFARCCIYNRRLNAALMISKVWRGVLARIKIPEVYEKAIIKSASKAFAIIRIRNFLRKSARDMIASPWFKQTEDQGLRGAFLAKIIALRDMRARGSLQIKLGSPGQAPVIISSTTSETITHKDIINFQRIPSQEQIIMLHPSLIDTKPSSLPGGKSRPRLSSAASSAARILGLSSFLSSGSKSSNVRPRQRSLSPEDNIHSNTSENAAVPSPSPSLSMPPPVSNNTEIGGCSIPRLRSDSNIMSVSSSSSVSELINTFENKMNSNVPPGFVLNSTISKNQEKTVNISVSENSPREFDKDHVDNAPVPGPSTSTIGGPDTGTENIKEPLASDPSQPRNLTPTFPLRKQAASNELLPDDSKLKSSPPSSSNHQNIPSNKQQAHHNSLHPTHPKDLLHHKDSIQSHLEEKTSTYLQRAEKMERLAAVKTNKSPMVKGKEMKGKEREKSPIHMNSTTSFPKLPAELLHESEMQKHDTNNMEEIKIYNTVPIKNPEQYPDIVSEAFKILNELERKEYLEKKELEKKEYLERKELERKEYLEKKKHKNDKNYNSISFTGNTNDSLQNNNVSKVEVKQNNQINVLSSNPSEIEKSKVSNNVEKSIQITNSSNSTTLSETFKFGENKNSAFDLQYSGMDMNTSPFHSVDENDVEDWLKPPSSVKSTNNTSSTLTAAPTVNNPKARPRKSIFGSLWGSSVSSSETKPTATTILRPNTLSIAGFGSAVNYLLPQQKKLLYDMGNSLRKGIYIIKHGRFGAPKERFLFCDTIMTKLYWRNVGSMPDEEDLSLSVDDIIAEEKGKKKASRRRSSIMKSENDREIHFKEIIEVRDEIHTDVMLRAYNTKAFKDISFDMKIISIILPDRTLDFEISSKDWLSVYHALHVVIKYYTQILPESMS